MKNILFALGFLGLILAFDSCSKQPNQTSTNSTSKLKSDDDGPGGGIGFSLYRPKYQCDHGFGVCKILWISFTWYPDGPSHSTSDPSKIPWCSATLNSTKDTIIGHFYSAVDTTGGNTLTIENDELADVADTVLTIYGIKSISLAPGTYHIDYSHSLYGILKIPVSVATH